MDDQKDIKSFDVENADASARDTHAPAEIFDVSLQEELIEKKEKPNWLRELYEWVQAIAVAVVLALIINQFIFAMVQVEGSSMLPTLESKERLVVTKLFYTPKAGDIVVVKSHALGKHIIKRVIAVPGDVLDINGETGDVTVNGTVLSEPYILEKLRSAGNANVYPLQVPENHVFVMGDNRNNSQDSRTLGLVAYEDVVGRASLRVTPFSRFGTLYDNLEE